MCQGSPGGDSGGLAVSRRPPNVLALYSSCYTTLFYYQNTRVLHRDVTVAVIPTCNIVPTE